MKIAVNTRLLQYGKLDGIGWFTYETLYRITRNHPEVDFFFVYDRDPGDKTRFPDNVKKIILHPPTRHPLLWYLWLDWRIPGLLKKLKPDLFLSPDGFISLRTKTPQLAVVHDINFMHRPQDLPILTGAYYRYFFPKFAQKAIRIATVSEYSRNDICQSFSVPHEKTDVVYNGANEIYSPVSELEKNKWKSENTEGFNYFIYVGSLHPRKNVDGLLKAFENFKVSDNSGIKLMIVGEPMFKTQNIRKTFNNMSFRKDVIMKGRLKPEDLKLAIGSAHALILVSHFEGFGIPVMEALKCQVPVICSDTTSLPEVVGDAALLVDPGSVHEISNAMSRICNEMTLRKNLITKGIARAALFSWNRTSDLLWNSIEKAIQS